MGKCRFSIEMRLKVFNLYFLYMFCVRFLRGNVIICCFERGKLILSEEKQLPANDKYCCLGSIFHCLSIVCDRKYLLVFNPILFFIFVVSNFKLKNL